MGINIHHTEEKRRNKFLMWMSHQITSSFWLFILEGTVWRWKAIINLSNKTWLNELRIDTFNHNHILLAIYFACTKTSIKHQLLPLHVFCADHYDKRYNLKTWKISFLKYFSTHMTGNILCWIINSVKKM